MSKKGPNPESSASMPIHAERKVSAAIAFAPLYQRTRHPLATTPPVPATHYGHSDGLDDDSDDAIFACSIILNSSFMSQRAKTLADSAPSVVAKPVVAVTKTVSAKRAVELKEDDDDILLDFFMPGLQKKKDSQSSSEEDLSSADDEEASDLDEAQPAAAALLPAFEQLSVSSKNLLGLDEEVIDPGAIFGTSPPDKNKHKIKYNRY